MDTLQTIVVNFPNIRHRQRMLSASVIEDELDARSTIYETTAS